MKINLISDTVTTPSKQMLDAMMKAIVGDDVFREDPTINQLEDRMAIMFGKEAALFCPSGTMTNQIGIGMHTSKLDELICDHYSHVYQYETGGYAYNNGVAINLIQGENGKITADQVSKAIKPNFDWLPNSRLVVLENSCNKGGGSYYTLEEIEPISKVCRANNLKLHLDGARLFNVLVETEESTTDVGHYFDSISICLSKGLGAPVGSVLIGDDNDIALARRMRKVMGGGMRQAGYLAAAGLYALDNNINRLKQDNNHAKQIGEVLQNHPLVDRVRPVHTNIVIFDLKDENGADKFLSKLAEFDILASAFGPGTIRFVFHLDAEKSMVDSVADVLENLSQI